MGGDAAEVGRGRAPRKLWPESGGRSQFIRCGHVDLSSGEITPQLRESLKSRIYYLASIMPGGDLPAENFDHGPVDEAILAGASGIKDGSAPKDVYDRAMAKRK